MSTDAITNLVKALTLPYVGAHIEYLDEDVKIWRVKKEKNSQYFFNVKNCSEVVYFYDLRSSSD